MEDGAEFLILYAINNVFAIIISMRRIKSGFTIVEILIVIAIIGILSTIGLVSFVRYQQDARDSQRSSDATIITEALEKYYDENGEYPSCTQLTQSPEIVSSSVLIGIDVNVLKTPKGTGNTISCNNLATVNDGDYFSYTGDTSDACKGPGGNACVIFTLKYIKEGSSEVASIDSRRQTLLAGTDIPNLSVSASGFTQIDSTWSGITGAVGYDVQYSTTSTFPPIGQANTSSNGTISTGVGATSTPFTGLQYGTPYNFRIRANNAAGSGSWSTTKTATTFSLTPPTTSISILSSTSFTQSWTTAGNPVGTTYTFQCSNDGVTWTVACQGSVSTPSYMYTGALQGLLYYVRVQAVNGSYTSLWSNIASDHTLVDVPTGVTATANSTTQITVAWNAVTRATSYDIDYSTSSTFSSYSTVNNATTSKVFTGLTPTYTYYYRVRANISPYSSTSSSPAANATTPTPSYTLLSTQYCTANYSARSVYRIELSITEASNPDIVNNTSNVTWYAYRTPNSQQPIGTYDETLVAGWSYSVGVNGSTVASGTSRSGRWRGRIAYVGNIEAFYGTNVNSDSYYSGTVPVTHNADGTKTINVSVYDGTTGIYGTASASCNYVLSNLR